MRLLTHSFDSVQDAHDQEFRLKDSMPLKCGLEFRELVLVLFDLAVDVGGGIHDGAFP